MPGTVLVTGASGFVGHAVVARLARDSVPTRAAVRRTGAPLASGAEIAMAPDLSDRGDWRATLMQVDAVVHCAARAHVLREEFADPLAEFRRVNVDGSVALAQQAADAGVRRFVFISSIGVNGAETFDRPFAADDAPAPHSPYAVSKHEAEEELRRLSQQMGMELVIIRPPLVFGPGVPGNFRRLLQALNRGIPLPLGEVRNLRSLVALDNLVDLISVCLAHPQASGQTFLVSDGEDLSTTALLRRAAAALGRRAWLIPVPARALRTAAQLLGRPEAAQRLCGSLQVDIVKTRRLLGWSPIVSVDDALAQTARHFLGSAA